ncbi:MAG: sensor histidine kinase [Bacteriovoracaceae bacterium]
MKDTSLKEIIRTKLWEELIIRSRYTAIPNVVLCLISWFVFKEMHRAGGWFSCLPYVMVILGGSIRLALLLKINPSSNPSKKVTTFYFGSVMLLASGWGVLFIFIQEYYSFKSLETAYCLVLMAGLCSGAISTFAASSRGYLFFIIPMYSIPVVYLFLAKWPESIYLIILMSFFTIFQLSQARIAHSYIRKSIQNEYELTIERDKIQSLINAVPGFVTIIDKDLCYHSINDFGRQFLQDDQIIGKQVGYKGIDSEYYRFVSNFMNGSRNTETREIKIGNELISSPFIVSIKKIFDPVGGAVIISLPMDELVKAREELKNKEAQAHYTAKLVSLGEMAAGIAHEINNPLAIIQGSADQIIRHLSRPGFTPDKIREFTEKIQNTVTRISITIKSLKALARNGEKDEFQPVCIKNFIEPALEVSRQRFKNENIHLEIIPDHINRKIIGQEIQLAQVMMNLLSNALDATLEAHEKWVKISVKDLDQFIEIHIQDSGPGIPSELKNKIMEPFFTTKGVSKGTGLGLSISKTIMENHGGALLLDETQAHTTFIMRFKV